jgi:hypothetical protein
MRRPALRRRGGGHTVTFLETCEARFHAASVSEIEAARLAISKGWTDGIPWLPCESRECGKCWRCLKIKKHDEIPNKRRRN